MNELEGNGKIEYNLQDDILYFYVDKFLSKGIHTYDSSVDLDGFVIDIDQDNHVIGLEILDASEKLNVSKIVLKFIKDGSLKAIIKKSRIVISLSLQSVMRNKAQTVTLNTERLNTQQLKESVLECKIPAAV